MVPFVSSNTTLVFDVFMDGAPKISKAIPGNMLAFGSAEL